MSFPDIDTPGVLVDLDIAEANIDRFQAHCVKHGLAVRPHIKPINSPSWRDGSLRRALCERRHARLFTAWQTH